MSTFIEKFYGVFASLPADFCLRLDRNLQRLAVETKPFATSLAGWTFREDDTVDSLQFDATAAASTVYLPAQPNGARRRRVIKTDVSANAVTVSGNGHNINGAATYVLAAQYNYVEVEPAGTKWLIVNSG